MLIPLRPRRLLALALVPLANATPCKFTQSGYDGIATPFSTALGDPKMGDEMTKYQIDWLLGQNGVSTQGFSIASLTSPGFIEGDCQALADMASSSGDPHLTFAHGGKADVRGEHGKTYAILSAPDFSFGMTTRVTDFMLPRQLVHGSFFTEAYFLLRTKHSLDTVRVFANASDEDVRFDVAVGGASKKFLKHRQFQHEDVSVKSQEVKLTVESGEWMVELTRRKINTPLGEIQFRYDTKVNPLIKEADMIVSPHGIIGQSFDKDEVAVDGKQDVYHGAGAELTTSAMAEGAIEGVLADYVLSDPGFSPDFKFNRFFTHELTPPRDVSQLTGPKRAAAASASSVGSTEEEEA